ncbi:MAG: 30S ribosomal protein S15 [Candidatus Micrarchaeia archaeon]
MAKLHTRRKGKSGSRKVKGHAKWVELTSEEIEKIIIDLRKAGNTNAKIGVILRDQYGVPSVREVCKKTITQIVEENIGRLQYPDDLLNLMKKAVNLRKHIAMNKSDIHNRIRLDRIESKLRRLANYYVRKGRLPAGWRYDPETAVLLVR